MQQNQTLLLLFLTNYPNNVYSCKPGFLFLKTRPRWYNPDHVHTMYPSTAWNKHFLHAMHFRCYNNYMSEENDNYKVMIYFLSSNNLLLFVFKIA